MILLCYWMKIISEHLPPPSDKAATAAFVNKKEVMIAITSFFSY